MAVVAKKNIKVIDELGRQRQVVAGTPVPANLLDAYNEAIGPDKSSAQKSAQKDTAQKQPEKNAAQTGPDKDKAQKAPRRRKAAPKDEN